jgi:hypothetical protein
VELYKCGECPEQLQRDLVAVAEKLKHKREAAAALSAAAEAAARAAAAADTAAAGEAAGREGAQVKSSLAAVEEDAAGGGRHLSDGVQEVRKAVEVVLGGGGVRRGEGETSSTIEQEASMAEVPAAAEGSAPADWRAGKRLKRIPIVIVETASASEGDEGGLVGESPGSRRDASGGMIPSQMPEDAAGAEAEGGAEGVLEAGANVGRSMSAEDIIAALPDDLLEEAGGVQQEEGMGELLLREESVTENHHYHQQQQQQSVGNSGGVSETAYYSSSSDDEAESLEFERRLREVLDRLPADAALEALSEHDPIAAAALAAGITLEPETMSSATAEAVAAAAAAAASEALISSSSSSNEKGGKGSHPGQASGAGGRNSKPQQQQQQEQGKQKQGTVAAGVRRVGTAPIMLTLQNVKLPPSVQEQAVQLHRERELKKLDFMRDAIAVPVGSDGDSQAWLERLRVAQAQSDNIQRKKQAAADTARDKGNGLLRNGKFAGALTAYKQALQEWPYDARPHANSSQVSLREGLKVGKWQETDRTKGEEEMMPLQQGS